MGSAPYYVAWRLTAIAIDHWESIDGEAASRGLDYLTLAPDQFYNLIYWWAGQRVKDYDRWLYELEKPPERVGEVVTQQDLEQDASSFMAFAGALGVRPPATRNGDDAPPPVHAPVASSDS